MLQNLQGRCVHRVRAFSACLELKLFSFILSNAIFVNEFDQLVGLTCTFVFDVLEDAFVTALCRN